MTTSHPDDRIRPVFSIRLDSELSAKEVARAVSAALSVNLEFQEFAHGGSEVYGTNALGLWVDMAAWPPWPVEGRYKYQLQGRLGHDIMYSDEDVLCNISDHIIDILARRAAGVWYIPSEEQVIAEMDLMEEWESDD